jgi:hypothetical protein
MPCEIRRRPDGTMMIVCSRRTTPVCSVADCGRPSKYLCDWPVGDGTCDRHLCEKHRTNVGSQRDFCPTHAEIQSKSASDTTVEAS